MSAQNCRLDIEADHPLVPEVFGALSPKAASSGASVEVLEKALDVLQKRFVYQPIRGRAGFDQLLSDVRASEPGERCVINCYDMSCLLGSFCRSAGWSAEEAFVVFCDRRLTEEMARVDFHACNLLRIRGEAYWVEPERLRVRRWTGQEILEEYKIRLVFNDKHIYFTEDDKRRVVMADIPAIGQQILIYGRGHNDIQAIYNEPAFGRAIAGYFETGAFSIEDDDLRGRMVTSGLLQETAGRLDVGSRMVLVPRQAELELRAQIGPAVDTYLGIVARNVPILKQAFEATETARHFEWSQVAHSIVAGMFIDLSTGARLDLAADVRDKYGETVVWAFENISAENGFGVQWHVGSHPARGVSQLWHRTVERSTLGLEREMAEMMIQLALGEQELSASPKWLYLKFHKLIREGRIVPPVFGPEDTARLLEPIMRGGDELVEQAYLPAFELAAEHQWWGRIKDDDRYRHAVVRLILEYATDRVISAGLLDP
ncbi:MAG: hypothetical protein AAGF23_08740, partial [Acidobacteriota bacterium]